MSIGNMVRRCAIKATRMKASGYFWYVPSIGRYLFKWGAGAPTGTPDAQVYIDTSNAGNTVYENRNGVWSLIAPGVVPPSSPYTFVAAPAAARAITGGGGATLGNTNQVLCTLIADLQTAGILS